MYTILGSGEALPTKKKASPNLSSDVFRALKDRIIRWEYPDGHRFIEEGLCAEFGVSRSPVREALRMLVENGLVRKQPHKGYSVRQPDMREIQELYEVRLALELHVVALLAKSGLPTEEWNRQYGIWSEILDDLSGTASDYVERDEEFHASLALHTGNRALAQHLETIAERLHFVRMMDINSTERLRVTCEQHLRILQCVKDGDAACARDALQMNIQDGRGNVEQAVKSALAKAYMGI